MLPLPRLETLLTVDDFMPHVGSTYRVEAVPQLVDIRLDEVLRRPRGRWMAREPFLLVFSSPWTVLLVAAHYRMRPEGGQPVAVYLIPSQSALSPRRLYHAVFN